MTYNAKSNDSFNARLRFYLFYCVLHEKPIDKNEFLAFDIDKSPAIDYVNLYTTEYQQFKRNHTIAEFGNTKNNDKMLISDSIRISNSPHLVSDNDDSDEGLNKNSLHILSFLYNVLNNNWTVKKTLKNEYVFIKKHEGRKEFFTEKYLHTFLKENFNSTLIK